MSKKDYEAVAKAVRSSRAHQWGDTVNAVDDVAVRLSVAFKADNPRFDVDRFLEACGVSNPRKRSVVVG